MDMRAFFIFSLLFVSLASFAQEDCDDDAGKKLENAVKKSVEQCPNAEKLDQFCSSVGGLEADDEGGDYKYYYQRQIFEASCTTLKEAEETRNSKIKAMWKKFENKELICNNLQFDIANGNIIKYAASRSIDPFIRDVIKWKVNLNKVDQTDGRTPLDYIKFHMERAKGGALEKKLQYYYEILRKAGAKHKTEL